MNKIKRFLFVLLNAAGYLLFSNSVFSQSAVDTTIGKVTISSPNAASLGKYGDIPVSYYTGIPNIDIPLYTIKAGKIELPIGLSYHASGLKVQEQASWVGAGWALNAGGVITRTVVGAPDDRGLNSAATLKGHFSDYGYSSYLYSTIACDPNNHAPSAPPCATGGNRPDIPTSAYAPQNVSTGIFDGEPDLYFFNFNGHSGKFYFNDDRTPVMVPEQDFKIIPIFPGNDWRGMIGFIITTSDGTKYYFGKNQNNDGNIDAIEITYDVTIKNQYNGQGATSAWYLNKIMSYDNQDSVILSYQQDNYSYYNLSMFPVPQQMSNGYYNSNYEYDINKNYINGVALSKINFANGEVDFNGGALRTDLSGALSQGSSVLADMPNNISKALGSITIKNTNSFCKNFNFFTSYFYDPSAVTGTMFTNSYNSLPNINSDKYRLRLDSIQEVSCDNSVKIPPYTFNYFTGTVPRKLSFSIDHWGFNNGVTTNTSLIPTYTLKQPSYLVGQVKTFAGADRDTHWPNALNGSLQQIKYPTGGSTSLDFESNSVYASRTTYVKTFVASYTAGYDGSTSHRGTFTTDGTGNTYELDMASNQPTSQTGGNIQFNGISIGSIAAGQTSIDNNYFTLTPSTTYNVVIYDNNNGGATTGVGVTATLYEMVPTTINANVPVGGLRIKTLTENDGVTSANIVKSYGYNFDNNASGNSSAHLYSTPVYVEGFRNDVWGLITGTTCTFGANTIYYRSPSSIRPMASSQGNHIGYGEVYVSQTGNGYSKYQYYIANGNFAHIYDPAIADVCIRAINTACTPDLVNLPAAPDPYDPTRGELGSEAHFNQAGQLLQTKTYFPLYQFDSLTTPGLIGRSYSDGRDPLSGGVATNVITEYVLQSAKKIRDSVVTIGYDPATGNSLTTVEAVYYGSKYHNEATKKLSINSKGENLVTNYKNAFDYNCINCNQYDKLATYNANILGDGNYMSAAIAGFTYPADPNYFWDRWNVYNNYRYMKAYDRKAYIAARLSAANNNAANHATAKAAAGPELKPLYELQDEFKNERIETSIWKNNNLLTAAFTRYDYVTNPAGIVYPNKVQAVNLSAPSSTFTAATISGNTIIKDSRYQDETVLKFYKGNVAEVTPKSGVTTAYIWGYNNTLPIVKAAGTDQTTLLNAYTNVGGVLSALPGQFPSNTVQLNTYVYTPLVGMTSETDANGKSISYAYDALGRLLLVRDFNNNILKQYEYKYQLTPATGSPQWTATGNTRCKPCPQNSNYITNILQNEERDNNPNSGSYNTLRWTDAGVNSACVSNADWQNTTTPVRCQQNKFGQYTGWQEQEQMDMNPCSSTYGQKQWVAVTYNPTICPVPATCNSGNCGGVNKKCINNICETGTKVYTASVYNRITHLYTCTYHYQWSDGSISIDYTETSATSCNITDGGR